MQLSGKLLPIIAFFGFLIKTIVISPSIPDSLIIFALVSYIVFDELRLKDKKLHQYDQKIKDLSEQLERQSTDIKNLQGAISSVKLASGMRQMTGKVV